MGGNVWIVGFEFDVLLRLGEVKQHDSVIDGEAWKTEQMHEGYAALAKRAFQLFRDAILKLSPDRKKHAPMAAQKIGFPGRSAFCREQLFIRLAERTQAVAAGNHEAFRFRAGPAWIAGNNF